MHWMYIGTLLDLKQNIEARLMQYKCVKTYLYIAYRRPVLLHVNAAC